MSQNDFNIANQGFPSFRSDLNSALQALASLSSGDTAPATTYANQLWYETDTNTLYIRDEANSAWLALMVIDQATGSPSFTAGEVGIGTDTPDAPLHVKSSLDTIAIFESTDSNSAISVIDSNTTGGSAAEHGLNAVGDQLEVRAVGNIGFETNGVERARIDSAGNVGIGTASPAEELHIEAGAPTLRLQDIDDSAYANFVFNAGSLRIDVDPAQTGSNSFFRVDVDGTERARIDSSGVFSVGCTALSTTSTTDTGAQVGPSGVANFFRSGGTSLIVMRQTNDGTLVDLRQNGTSEGTISVSGTTVSYNGGHLSRWAQLPDNSRPELLKGTVMSNLDQMSNWDGEDNEQLNCVQVSAVEGDANVAGVFVAWDNTDDGYNDILLAMTGDMVIRIAAGTTVQRGDLLMSAGDGTAKPQGDDIVRSKTIAKVTSTHVSHTYADGSYAVPCVLMAC